MTTLVKRPHWWDSSCFINFSQRSMPSSAKLHISRVWVWDSLVRSKVHLGPTGVGQRTCQICSDTSKDLRDTAERHWFVHLKFYFEDCHLLLGGGIFVILRPVCAKMLSSLQVLDSGLFRMPSRAASTSQHTVVVRTSWEWLVRKWSEMVSYTIPSLSMCSFHHFSPWWTDQRISS